MYQEKTRAQNISITVNFQERLKLSRIIETEAGFVYFLLPKTIQH